MAITLSTNKVFATLSNMIISTQVFPNGIQGLSGIYSSRRVDGTLYGDRKRYISTDALKSYAWDGTDTPGNYNLLTIHRPPAPYEQTIIIDQFRQVPVTVDEYLTKQAFADEGSFAEFNGVILSWLNKTKEVFEHTKFTADILITAQEEAKAFPAIALAAPANMEGYDLLRWRAQELYRVLEDQIKELEEPSREWNDLGFLRTYKLEDFDIVFPLGVLSGVRKHDIPFLYDADNKPKFKEVHWKYFGVLNESGGTTDADNEDVRSLVEKDYGNVHVFPGDLLPDEVAYEADETYTATYTERPNINTPVTALLIHKRDFPVMSAFTVGTSFFNARRLDINNYLTFGYNNLQNAHIKEHALIKVATTVA